MEHHLGLVLGEHPAHPIAVPDVGHHQVPAVEHGPALDRELHGVQRGLVALDHDQAGGGEPVQLAAELGADRAAGPGDEHPLAGDVARDRRHIGVVLVAAEQVGRRDGTDVGDLDAGAVELARRGQHQQLDGCRIGELLDLADERRAGAGDGEQGDGGALGGRHLAELGVTAPDGHAPHAQVALERVVVEQGHREVAAARVAQHGGDDLVAALAGADDHHALHVGVRRTEATLEVPAPDVADTGAGREHEAGRDERDRQRDGPAEHQGGAHQDDGGHGHALHHGGELLEGAEAPLAAVEPRHHAGHQVHHHGDEREGDGVAHQLARQGELVAQPRSGDHRHEHGGSVGDRLDPAPSTSAGSDHRTKPAESTCC